MGTLTGEFLGDRTLRRAAEVMLDDVHGLWGGKQIKVRGDGFAFVTIVDLTGSSETYRLNLSPGRVKEVLDLCTEIDVLAVSFPERTPDPDEARVLLSITNAGGKERSVTYWVNTPADHRFEVVRTALTAVAEEMQQFNPVLIASTPAPAATSSETPKPTPAARPIRSPQRVLQATIDFFERDKWTFTKHADRPVLRMSFQGKNGKWNCVAQVRVTPDVEQLLFYSVMPINVPEAKRPAVAEFIARANYGMAIGNFEMDYNDGEIRYKTSIDATDADLPPELIKPLVHTNVLMMDKYFSGIMSVIYANIPPAEAVKQIEG